VPLLIPVERITPTPIPAATPQTPKSLKGKIAFLSDRYGESRLFVMDPDGSHVALLTQDYPYLAALLREPVAADGRRRAFVKPNDLGVPQIFGRNTGNDTTWAITAMTAMAYAPAWSPVSDRILFVGTEAGNDEIYAIDADGTDLTRLTANSWQLDKHPSWSADGRQIVFYSSRATARRQIWIMDANGGNVRNISHNNYEDWDPVWIK
jgi:Tol biopolymer transport system component